MSKTIWLVGIVAGGLIGGFLAAGMNREAMERWSEPEVASGIGGAQETGDGYYADDNGGYAQDDVGAQGYAMAPGQDFGDNDEYAAGEARLPAWMAPPSSDDGYYAPYDDGYRGPGDNGPLHDPYAAARDRLERASREGSRRYSPIDRYTSPDIEGATGGNAQLASPNTRSTASGNGGKSSAADAAARASAAAQDVLDAMNEPS
ncbi:hypothetical protein I5E68_15200 [Novosphingobium sp. YJ-S2-02]|uniref:Uncharacterized protein n=1 Tax=Novosphingobium aureum TaxID=2792964 RepID=A0A931HFA2_9SPHN|nr:hypothetical protein [Novosphingobium aureum]MBH0114291.1 hypothetical protein [Novosphingobium aureum]